MKKLLLVLVVGLLFISCNKIGTTKYDRIIMTCGTNYFPNEHLIDVTYKNHSTGVTQTWDSVEFNFISETCFGGDYNAETLILPSDYVSGDTCSITVRYKGKDGDSDKFRIGITLLEVGEDQCDILPTLAAIEEYNSTYTRIFKN